MRLQRFLFTALCPALVLWGCAHTPSPTVAQPETLRDRSTLKAAQVEPKARPLFLQAERFFQAQKYPQALDAYRQLQQKFRKGAAYEIATYRIASVYYLKGQYSEAAQSFSDFLRQFPQSELAFDSSYNLAASQFQLRQYENALKTLQALAPETIRSQGPERASVVYGLGARAAAAMGQNAIAVVYLSAQLQVPGTDPSTRTQLQQSVDYYLSQLTEAQALQTVMTQISEPWVRAQVTARLSALSAQPAVAMPSPLPLGDEAAPTEELGLKAATSGYRNHIGVVLPLSGPNAPYGKRALEGILLAAGVFEQNSRTSLSLFIEDTQSNPALAAQAVERLYRDHHVVAIVGPISWRESLAAGDRAQELGLMNICLAGKEGISDRGAYLFQNALTPRVQMQNLVRHSVEVKQMRRFAILAPNNPYGDDMATEFAAAAKQMGALIVGYETYPPDSRDFQRPVRELVGLGDARMRKMESAKLEEFAKQYQQRTGRATKATLPPIVDFDALFIPDGPKTVAQIAASLAYFDVTGVRLLGTSEWNNDQLYKRGGRLVQGALFPGGLQLTSNSPRQREFIRGFAQKYGSVPDLLATQAYEALELAVRGAYSSGGNRNAAVQALMELKDWDGPLGLVSFQNSRTALRSLPILSLEPGGNIVAQ